ncbi:MAG: nucleotidyltransferase domain-containing protein [Planctomycetes bacterium]|nr:nucleotidyltransferase domain-containing protein [Planctomycetota bacterium]
MSQPERVILFGSAAAGAATGDSDIDLLVVDDSGADPRAQSVRIRDALDDLEHPFDVIVMNADRFNESKDVIGGIAYPAHHRGVTIYARS